MQARLRFLQTVSTYPWHQYFPASQEDCIVRSRRPFSSEQKFRKNPSIPSPFCLGAAFSTCWLVVMFAVGNLWSVPSPNSCGLCGFARACFILKTATTRINSDCYEKGKWFVQINHRANKLKSTAAREMIFLKCYDPFLQSIGNNWRRVKITKSLQNLTLLSNQKKTWQREFIPIGIGPEPLCYLIKME